MSENTDMDLGLVGLHEALATANAEIERLKGERDRLASDYNAVIMSYENQSDTNHTLRAALATREAEVKAAQDDAMFWLSIYGEALDALDECAGDDEEGWDRQQHAERASERLHAKHQSRAAIKPRTEGGDDA